MCDSVVVTGAHTASGATLFAKNSDRHANECQPFLQFPEALHSPGTALRCTHIEIPQVAATHRVMGHSPHWVWGFEHGVNEHAVAIGNHTVFSREPVEDEPGLIGMDLVRLGLERGASARAALDVIARLVETHGQGGAAFGPGEAGYHNSFTIADAREAWQLETSGRHWAARPVERGALSNQFCIGDDWTLASADCEGFAREQGWAELAANARLHVEHAYRHPEVPGRISEPRVARTRAWLAADHAPRFSVAGAIDLLRDHGATGAPPPLDAPLDDEARFTLCMHAEPVGTTTASMVVELPRDRTRVWPVWVGFGSPCVGAFVPVYLDGVIPAEFASADEHFGMWAAFHRLGVELEASSNVWARAREMWSSFEKEQSAARTTAERAADDALRAGKSDLASEILSAFMRAAARAALRAVDQLLESANATRRNALLQRRERGVPNAR